MRFISLRVGAYKHGVAVLGEVAGRDDVLVRVHSKCVTGDVFGSLRCDCGPQLRLARVAIAEAGLGVLIYLDQEGRGIGLANKLRAYGLQDAGLDTVDANVALDLPVDSRDYSVAATVLRGLGVRGVRLLTNNPDKVTQLSAAGIPVTERVALVGAVNAFNRDYLVTKAQRLGHLLVT